MARSTGLALGSTRHHVQKLKVVKLILEMPYRATLRYFENTRFYQVQWRTIATFRERALFDCYVAMIEEPPRPQSHWIEALGQQGMAATTVQNRLTRLVEEDFLNVRFTGRHKLYEAKPLDAEALDLLGSFHAERGEDRLEAILPAKTARQARALEVEWLTTTREASASDP